MTDHTTIPEKRCTKCGELFPATAEYFTRKKSRRDGLYSQCKACKCQSDRTWRANNLEGARESNRTWYAANPERQRERSRAYYAANRERVRERHRAYHPIWYAANRERAREKKRTYRAANPERIRETQRAWRAANLERMRVINQNREARKRGLPNTFTLDQQRFALDCFHNACAYCGRQFRDLFNERTLAFDHFIPLSSPDCPGTTATNMLPVCHGVDSCNLSKGARDPEEWLVSRFGKRKARAIRAEIKAYFKIVREQYGDTEQE